MTKLHELAELGQAIWLDYISRSLIASGELQELVDQGLRGVTSNPSIFEKAIAGSADYDEDLDRLVREGRSVGEIYEDLAMEDIRSAADVLRPVYEKSGGADGYVSLEVNPALAHDTEATIAEARRLFGSLERPNVMIKVPATAAGIPAIETLIGEGVNVNVTLIFSLEQYEAAATAYIAGLEKLALAGGDVGSMKDWGKYKAGEEVRIVGHGDETTGKLSAESGPSASACAGCWRVSVRCERRRRHSLHRCRAPRARRHRPRRGGEGLEAADRRTL